MTTDTNALTEKIAEALILRDTLHPAIAYDLAAAVLPLVRAAQADAWDEAIRYSIECANETTDSWGNMYRLDWIARMEHEIEESPYRATDIKEEN